MKKITESQLKDKVNSLREYLKVYELSEEGRGGDDFSTPIPAAVAPAGNRNFLQRGMDAVSDFHKKNTERFNADKAADAAANSPEGMAAAKAKLTPSQLTWLGNAQPNSAILSRMPKPLPGETAPAAAPTGTGLKPPKYGPFGTETRPLDGSDDRRVNGQGLKMPAQAPAAAGQRPGGVAFNQDKAAQDSRIADRMDAEAALQTAQSQSTEKLANLQKSLNPYDMFKKADGSPAAPPGFKPPPPGVIWSEPDAGEHATKVARFKELIAKAKELRTDAQVAHAKSLGDAMEGSTRYFLNKLRLIESRQLNEELSSEEQAEMDALSAELGQQGAENDPDLMAAINDYNSLPTSAAQAAVPYIGPSRAQQADMEASSQGPTPTSDLANANAQDQQADMDASSQGGTPAFNAALSTELRAIAADAQKLGPNSTPDDVQPLFNRLKKVETDAAGAGEDIRSAVQAMMPVHQANLKKVSDFLAAGPTAAKNPLAGVTWAYAVGDGTVAGSAKMAADAAAAAKYGSAFTGVGNPGEQAAADKAAQANQAAAVSTAGPITWNKIHELNRDKIKDPNKIYPGQVLKMPNGLPDYTVKAGDNLSKIAKNANAGQGAKVAPAASAASAAPATQSAGSVPASASLATGEKIIPTVRQSSPAPVAKGGAKAVADLNKEPIQFPAKQAAKTNSYDAGRDPKGAYRADRSDATVMDPKQPGFDFRKASTVANAQNKQVAKESVGYNELQRIMSLVNHR